MFQQVVYQHLYGIGGIFNYSFIANLPMSPVVKKNWKIG